MRITKIERVKLIFMSNQFVKDMFLTELIMENNIFSNENNKNEAQMMVNVQSDVDFVEAENNNMEVAAISFDFSIKTATNEEFEGLNNKDKATYKEFEEKKSEGLLKTKYIIKYTIEDIEQNELKKKLLEFIEPYFRNEVEKLLTNMRLPNYILPYRFWSDEY